MDKKQIILIHPTGNANVRATLQALYEGKMLKRFFTSIACFNGNIFEKLSRLKGLSEFNRRRFDEYLQPFTTSVSLKELSRLLALKLKLNVLVKHETGQLSVDAVYQSLDKHVAKWIENSEKDTINGVYAFEDGAEYVFEVAKRNGIKTFYDLPTGYWRTKIEILEAQRNSYPEWRSTINALIDSEAKLSRKDHELELADCIFVASQFTADSLRTYPGKLPKVSVIPYGFPDVNDKIKIKEIQKDTPLKLLFVGSLSQQKGIANLFEAVNLLVDKVELTVVGRKSSFNCEALNIGLSKYTWIPSLPHSEILELMHASDLLVFPTLFDGFGLVITESMSQGTPVITTYNCAGPDLIENGRNGWLFNAGSTEELTAIISNLYKHPESIVKAGIQAIETARQRPWSKFRQELIEKINEN